jgi:putative ABC transport system permease protein
LAVPPVAALMPAIGGARITVRRAISSYGLGGGFGSNWLDRLIGQIRRLPRPLALGLRNTFRRKGRVALTLLTLVLGGVMFIMVLSLDNSLNNTLELMLGDFGFDIWVFLDRAHRVARLVEVAESVPGVARAEVWGRGRAQLSLASGEELDVGIWGVPLDSEMFSPRIASGRGLLPDDVRAILLNSKIATDEGFQVGDEIELTIGERESTWTVVGLILSITNQQSDNFVPFSALAQETGSVDRGSLVWVTSERRDPEAQEALVGDLRDAFVAQDMETTETPARLIRNLRDVFAARRIKTTDLQTAEEVQQQSKGGFDIVTYLMLAMAILAAVVGSIGLMSTMSINVVERGREIGVMRATGAVSSTIAGIFVAEGVLLGVLSWLLAAPLSYPSAQVFSRVIGNMMFNVPLDFSYSIFGLLLWLLIVVVLSALASLWPALGATRISVRESLSYE